MAVGKFGAKEVLNVTLYDMATDDPVIFFDTLKTSSLEITSEKVYARGGRGNSKLITWEIDKEGTLSIEDALLSPKSLELLSGHKTTVGAQTLQMRQKTEYDTSGEFPVDKGEYYPLTCTSAGVINLAYTPTEAATQIKVYLDEDDCGEKLDMTGATLAGNILTLGSNAIAKAGGKKVVVYYHFKSADETESYLITADKFAGTYKMVGDTVVRNLKTGKDEPFQVVVPNLKWTSNLTLDLSAEGDPAPTSFECEVMKAPDSPAMVQMYKYPY